MEEMKTIYQVEGKLCKDFIGQISYTVCLDRTYGELDIEFSFECSISDTLAAQGKKIVYGCLNLRQANLVIEELRFINQMFGGFIIGKLVDSLIIGIICARKM